MADEGHIFKVKDCYDKEIIFTQKKYEQKRKDHPELNKPKFMVCLKLALSKPYAIWPDQSDPKNKKVFYKKYGRYAYARAVVWYNGPEPFRIVSAYEIDRIKEEIYPELNRII